MVDTSKHETHQPPVTSGRVVGERESALHGHRSSDPNWQYLAALDGAGWREKFRAKVTHGQPEWYKQHGGG